MSANRSRRAAFAVWWVVWLLLAAAIWIWAAPMQLARGCWLGEWPFEEGCANAPSSQAADNPPQVYLEHLQRNVGDSNAWALLTRSMWLGQDDRAPQLLRWATQVAPYHPMVLATQAEVGFKTTDWPMTAQALVHLVERGHGSARKPLIALMLAPESQAAVLAQLNSESRWLDGMLTALDPKLPAGLIEPYVSRGSELGVLRPATVLTMVDRLKANGSLHDAYMLWVGMRGQVKEGLYNPDFDRQALRRGFDWEWPQQVAARQGLRVSQVSAAPQAGLMIEVEMTGRAALPQPMMAQTVVLLGDKYHLSGRYMSDRLRTTDGVVWALRCASGGDRWAQSAALKDTQRKWEQFELDLRVPTQCAGVVKLQLETASAWEAKAGMAGEIYFDDFVLLPAEADAANKKP